MIDTYSFGGGDLVSIALETYPWFKSRPEYFGILGERLPEPVRLPLEPTLRGLRARYPDYFHVRLHGDKHLLVDTNAIKGRGLSVDWSPPTVLERLLNVSLTFGTLGTPMKGLWFHEFQYEPEVPLSGHDRHGLYCAIKGQAGHDHLASRRILEYGPWRLLRDEQHDLSLVQFYDHEETDPETAGEQAADGHYLLSDYKAGCFDTTGYGYRNQIRGFYVAAQRQLRIVVHGRELPYSEMLDACALRYYRRDDPDEPLDSVAFVFMDPAEAQKYLHDLWLRELQCWTIIDGQEVRLDADYHPTPVKPDWVAKVEAREAAGS